jgi:hypothetical protein
MRKKRAVIISAQGENTFSLEQKERLAAALGFDDLLGECDVVVLLNSQARGEEPVISAAAAQYKKNARYFRTACGAASVIFQGGNRAPGC